ncbi:MAG: GNAT family N-acetyltransferase [Porphyromonas sp.]|nr:GNAT family N-acetyltransferase [Porphyromonas sp.]
MMISPMVTLQPIAPTDRDPFDQVVEIYLSSFPREERREVSSMEWLLEHEESYHLLAIQESDETVGMFAYWDLGETVYLEHFALDPKWRGDGIGTVALTQLMERLAPRTVLFEVELPETEVAKRRIGFYERLHFKLWRDFPYEQPPYRAEDSWLPMILVTNGREPHEELVEELYRKVYHITSNG